VPRVGVLVSVPPESVDVADTDVPGVGVPLAEGTPVAV
jgi:hypothetical protein